MDFSLSLAFKHVQLPIAPLIFYIIQTLGYSIMFNDHHVEKGYFHLAATTKWFAF